MQMRPLAASYSSWNPRSEVPGKVPRKLHKTGQVPSIRDDLAPRQAHFFCELPQRNNQRCAQVNRLSHSQNLSLSSLETRQRPFLIAVQALEARVSREIGIAMLWTIFVVLCILWLLGMVTSYTFGGFIHILLVVALVLFLFNVIQGRRRVV